MGSLHMCHQSWHMWPCCSFDHDIGSFDQDKHHAAVHPQMLRADTCPFYCDIYANVTEFFDY